MNRVLASRKSPWLFAVLAMLVTLPSLLGGYWIDDHLFMMRFKALSNVPKVQNDVFDMNVSGSGDTEQNRARMDDGTLPWWADEHWKIAFWRPLAGVSHFADWMVFGDRAWLMHAHNVVLYGILAFLLALLYRRMMLPGWVAGLAALMYLLNAQHAGTVSWIATRNTLMSCIFVVLVVYFHDRWRRDRWLPGLFAGLISLAFGLLASEGAVSSGAYLAAYALFVDGRGGLFKRFVALLPYLALVIVWRMVYDSLGYGVGGTLLYTDPVARPGIFASHVIEYLPILLGSLMLGQEPGLWTFVPPPWNAVCLFVVVCLLVFMAWALWPLLKTNRMARFWALGMVLSLLPICTVFPQGRELMNASMGGFALMALFLEHSTLETPKETFWRGKAVRVLAVAWVVLHVALAAVMAPVTACTAGLLPVTLEQNLVNSAPSDYTSSTMIIVCLPGDLLCSAVPLVRATSGQHSPPFGRTLCAGVDALDITRTDSRTLVFDLDDGFLKPPYCQVFRDPGVNPMRPGQVVRLTGFSATVMSITDDGRPKQVTFRFDVPLEDPSLRWMTFEGTGLVPFTLPEVGQKVRFTALGLTLKGVVPRRTIQPSIVNLPVNRMDHGPIGRKTSSMT